MDSNGCLAQFAFNDINRELGALPISVERVQKFYQAFGGLTDLVQDKENQARIKMRPGEIITVNNARLLHGRGEVTDQGDTSRILEVAYMDWDVVLSKLRVLAKNLEY